MSIHQPGIETMQISEFRGRLNKVVNRVYQKETRVIVAKSGIPVAALVSLDDLERLDRLDRERAERFKIVDKVREAFRGVPEEEIQRETNRILGINQEAPEPVSAARES